MGKVDGVTSVAENKNLPKPVDKDFFHNKYSKYLDEYNVKVNLSGNIFQGCSGYSISAAGIGVSGGKGNFSANATTFIGTQANPKKYPFSYTTFGTDYVYPLQDNNKIKLSFGTWFGSTVLGSNFSGIIPTRVKCELPFGMSLTTSPILEHCYSNTSGHKNQVAVFTSLNGKITDNLSWYVGHWLFDATRQPKKSENNEIDVGIVYSF